MVRLDRPSPSIQAIGIGGGWTSQYYVETESNQVSVKTDKPLYRVPSMAEIAAVSDTGLRVVSTFSGCGGSCLGYRMAGFKVVWANEFVPSAQASYKANKTEDCFLDCRDIRNVQPKEILKQTGLKRGELDLLDGSPPCQAFSTAGKREKGWGKAKTYEHGAKQCNEQLFDEYVRILRGLKPKVFVAENVSGLVKGTAIGMFLDILKALKASGYRVECRVLDAQWLGVPQTRQRVIFIGVRKDLNGNPAFPKPFPYRYSVLDALPEIGMAIYQDGYGKPDEDITDKQARAARAARAGTFQVVHESGGFTEKSVAEQPMPATQCHVNIEWPNRGFRGGTKSSINDPLPSVQTSPGVTGGTGGTVITDGVQKRKLTIAELKRICAFPDDFVLLGSYAQQWACLGNSVPPLMMFQVAKSLRDEVFAKFES